MVESGTKRIRILFYSLKWNKGNNGIESGNTPQDPVIPHKIRYYPTYLVTNPPKIVTTPLSLYYVNTFKKKVYEC